MSLLIAPKLLGYIAALFNASERRGFGGGFRAFASVLFEIVLSGLIAPMMMMLQSQSVADVLRGRDSGWQVQRRDDGSLTFSELMGRFGKLTLVGVLLGAAAYAVSLSLFLWMTPVIVGLLLAMPLAAMTARADVGRRLRRIGLLLIPEERAPPKVLLRANELAVSLPDDTAPIDVLLRSNADLAQAHGDMLAPPWRRRRGDIDHDLVIARAKADEAESLDEALSFLTPAETRALLSDRSSFERLLAKDTA